MKNKGNAAIFLVAIAFIILGGVLLISQQIQTKGYIKTQAVVVGHKESGDPDSKSRAEIVRYNTPKGSFTATNPVYSDFAAKVGENIDIAYDPNNPSDCVFIKTNTLASGILLGVGILSLIIGVVSTVLRKRAKKSDSLIEDSYGGYDEDDDWRNI